MKLLASLYMQLIHPSPWVTYDYRGSDPEELLALDVKEWSSDYVRNSFFIFVIFVGITLFSSLLLRHFANAGEFNFTPLPIYYIWVWWGCIFLYSIIQKSYLLKLQPSDLYGGAIKSIHHSTVWWVAISLFLAFALSYKPHFMTLFLLSYLCTSLLYTIIKALLPLVKSYLNINIENP